MHRVSSCQNPVSRYRKDDLSKSIEFAVKETRVVPRRWPDTFGMTIESDGFEMRDQGWKGWVYKDYLELSATSIFQHHSQVNYYLD